MYFNTLVKTHITRYRTLSATGKVLLIKSNLTGISQYPMNFFKFSKFVASEIDKINRDFIWDTNFDLSNENKYELHTLA